MTRSTKAGLVSAVPGRPLWQLLGVCAVALTTANCAQNPQQKFAGPSGSTLDPKYGVKASPRLYKEGDVIPKGGGRRFSGKPYVVAGRTYVPREDAKGYVREGQASWYGAAFHGRLTANGEVFDRNSIAAAHPTLPLPSYARVTNLANRRSMIVRVNDRGPYHADRIMDVSEEVAQALEFHRGGTSRVRVEYVGKASTAGSDDRKLLATLRTDGVPAAIRGASPVMVADLGPDEPLARGRSALAFKPAADEAPRETAPEAASETVQETPREAPRPARVQPILLASAAGLAVPAAVQPTAVRETTFRHVPTAPVRLAPAPLALTPPPVRLAARGIEDGHRTGGRMQAAAQPLTRTAAAWPAPSVQPKAVARGTGRDVAPVHAVAAGKTTAADKTVVASKGGVGKTVDSAKAGGPVKAVAVAKATLPPAKVPAKATPVLVGKATLAPVGKAAPARTAVVAGKPARARVAEAR
ncbi:septal ring lytic transglycosylase RlpA family protein [Methylobacterium sp. Leaf112]|uniref:septal ring lytic transglycosylase RlpA family protein n=1 Tax=Methylobacterium sp. Leaf112 TaxID=1736258 RepID=UPI0006F2CE75|nr:septal ring lytic transglycosylase RlpA family protein [Methylobacterium sp. Leaf112]KQP67876.1 hypothetical protein ASF52_18470 [Methylobacterium sp. Leaf112]